MNREAIGLIETVGLAASIEAADAALKSANVSLIGYELTKGGGMVTIKVAGDVGAVNAAIDAGVAAARRVSTVWSHLIIARPHEDLDSIIKSEETIGVQKKAADAEKPVDIPIEVIIPETEEPAQEIVEEPKEEIPETPREPEDGELCNLCHDPACPRKRGEPRVKCIHYDEE